MSRSGSKEYDSLPRVRLDLKERVFAGSDLLGGERLRADEHHVAEPPDAIQQRSQFLQDDLEALTVIHGSISGGGRFLAYRSMSRSACSPPRPPTPKKSTVS